MLTQKQTVAINRTGRRRVFIFFLNCTPPQQSAKDKRLAFVLDYLLMKDIANLKFSSRAIHAGQEPDPTTGAVSVPIYQTSTYAQEGIGKHKGFEYARTQN